MLAPDLVRLSGSFIVTGVQFFDRLHHSNVQGMRSRHLQSRALLVASLFRLPFLGRIVSPAVPSADGSILTRGTLNTADRRKLTPYEGSQALVDL